jgi:hypothetical protein
MTFFHIILNGEPTVGFFLHDNAPAHRSVLIKNNVTTVEHPHTLPTCLGVISICSFLLKSTLKGRHFCDVTDIIENATEELKRFLQNGFQECFQHVCSRWQKCIVAQGEYFEGCIA